MDNRIEYYVNMHYELHGARCVWEDIHKDYMRENPTADPMIVMDKIDSIYNKIKASEVEYGIFIGRCRPFHNGHNGIVQDIIRDGKKPIIFIGGKGKTDSRHPISSGDSVKLIKKVYPFGNIYVEMEDQDNWTDWFNTLMVAITNRGIDKSQVTLYAHTKESDKTDFKYEGKHYTNSSYIEMFKINGIKIKDIDVIRCTDDIIIHGTEIRAEEEIAKKNLDARIYQDLKTKYGWWKN